MKRNKAVALVYTINDIEYAHDGECFIGVSQSLGLGFRKFKLSSYGYRLSWLSCFKENDLEVIFQITKRQYGLISWRSLLTFLLIKICLLTYALNTIDEVGSFVNGEQDDW